MIDINPRSGKAEADEARISTALLLRTGCLKETGGNDSADCHETRLAWSVPVSWTVVCNAHTLTSTHFSVESPASTAVRRVRMRRSTQNNLKSP